MSIRKSLQLLKDAATELVGLENETIEEVKDEVKEEIKEEVKLAQETLDNEAIIEAESFEAGQPVFIVNEEERVALPVGEYTLADGRALVVAEEGVIESIGEAMEEEAEEVDAAADFVTRAEFNEAIDSIKAMFSKEEAELKKVEDELILSKEVAVKLQKEIDETPDAKPIKVAPKGKVKLTKAKTTKGRLLNYVINK